MRQFSVNYWHDRDRVTFLSTDYATEIRRLSQLSITLANALSDGEADPAFSNRVDAIRSLTEQIKEELATVLSAMAEMVCDRSSGFECSKKAPGYLVRVGRNTPLFIPWFIADDLPPPDVMDWLEDCAIAIRTSGANTIGISGSTLFFGSLNCLSDLDFLEYQEDRDRYPPTIQNPEGFILLKSRDDYLEYVTTTPFFGTLEVTNMIVPLEYAKDGYGKSDGSHPYQEAPLKSNPRELEDPESLAKYLHHLASQAISYSHNNPTKSAKRLLPLARIVGDTKLSDWIIDAFEGEELEAALKVKQKVALLKKLNSKGSFQETAETVKIEIGALRDESHSFTKLSSAESNRIKNLEGAINNKIAQTGTFLYGYLNYPPRAKTQ